MMDKSRNNNFFCSPEFVKEMRIRAHQLHQLNSEHSLCPDPYVPDARSRGFFSTPAFKRDFFREISRRNQPAVVAAPVAPPVVVPAKRDNDSPVEKKLDERFFFCDRSFVKEMRVQAQKMHQENREAAQNGFFDQLDSRKGQCVVIVPDNNGNNNGNNGKSLPVRPQFVSTVAYYPSIVVEEKKEKKEEKKKENFFCSRPFVRELRVRAQKMHRENSQAVANGEFDRLESRKGQCVVFAPAPAPAPVPLVSPRRGIVPVPPAVPRGVTSRGVTSRTTRHNPYLARCSIVAVKLPVQESSLDSKKERDQKFFCSRPFVRELRIRAQQLHQANVRHFDAIHQQRNALNKTGYFCSQGFKRDLFAEIKKREIEMNAGSSSSSSSSASLAPRVARRAGYFCSEGFKKDLFSTVQKFEAPAPAPVVVVDNSSASASSSSSSSASAARSVSDILRSEVDCQVFMDNLVKMKAMGFADGMVNARALLDANNDLPKAVLIMAQRLL